MNKSMIISIKFKRFLVAVMVLAMIGCVGTSTRLNSDGMSSSQLKVIDAYQPSRPPSMKMTAGYLTVENSGDESIRIIGLTSSNHAMAEIHRSMQMDGVFSMEPVPYLEVLPGEQLILEPGGLHLMLHAPVEQLSIGESMTIVFELEDGSSLPFQMMVTGK